MQFSFDTVSVIGLGYIGLPTAAALADSGVKVIGVDVNKHAVDTINRGAIHIIEPDLDAVVQRCVQSGRLKATLSPEPADAFLIAVPTPFKGDDYEPDLYYIESACKALAPVLQKGNLVILESTSPVGATEKVSEWLAQARPDLTFPQQADEDSDIRVAHCPERVLPGRVMRELVENDRIIGGMTVKCAQAAVSLYKNFVQGDCIITSCRTAEMCKLTENAYRDVNIAFANELSILCDEIGVDVWELISLANRHPRVNILKPGCGVGGHCIAVDPWFIVHKSPKNAKLIRSSREVNDGKPNWVIEKVKKAIAAVGERNSKMDSQNLKVACLGLTFKENIDDMRESPALKIVENLAQNVPCQILAVEPNVHALPESLSNLGVSKVDLKAALEDADVLVVLVPHNDFKNIKNIAHHQTVVDAVGLLNGSTHEK